MECSIIFVWVGFINYACRLRHLKRLSRQSTFFLTAMGTQSCKRDIERVRERGREIQERIFMLIRRIIGWGRTEVLGLFSTSANKRLKPQTCCSYSTPFRSGFSTTKCNFAAFLYIFFILLLLFIFFIISLTFYLNFLGHCAKHLLPTASSFSCFPRFPYMSVCVCVCNF